MKTSGFKSLMIAGAILVISGLATTSTFAQRSGRGGGGSFHGPSRGGSGGFSRPSYGHGFHGGGRITHFGPGPVRVYRPGFRGYYRPYYAYHNFYRPFLGLSINVLPFGYYPFYFGPDQFYYSEGLFYRQYDKVYKVVVPPVGAEVPSIPAEAKEVTINGQTFYEYKGVYYNVATNADGKTVYVVAGKDGVLNTDNNGAVTNTGPQIGDVVDQLPDNYREIIIKGEKYYVSEDGVYYEKVVNGNQVTYKVIGVGN